MRPPPAGHSAPPVAQLVFPLPSASAPAATETQTIQVIDYATAQAIVANDLTTNLRQISDESFDTVPFFHLDPLDFARVTTPTDSHDMQISAFTLPLTTADMTLNDKVYVPNPSTGR